MTDALKIAVEKAVRPVPAPIPRKLRMRQELLELLSDIYADELTRQPSDAAALQQALRRFGPPEELARELQQSLTWKDRWGHRANEWFRRRPGESPLMAALRVMGLMALWIGVLGGLAIGGRLLVGRDIRPGWVVGVASVVFLLLSNTFILTWLGVQATEVLRRGDGRVWRSLKIWGIALAGGASVGLTGLTALTVVARGGLPDSSALLTWGLNAIVTPLMILGVLQALQREIRSVADWENLDLERNPESC